MTHFASVTSMQGAAPVSAKPVSFASGPKVTHVPLANSIADSEAIGRLTALCKAKKITSTLLDEVHQLPATLRHTVYRENSRLRKALGITKPGFWHKLFKPASTKPPFLLNNPTSEGLKRLCTALAYSVVTLDKAHYQQRGLKKLDEYCGLVSDKTVAAEAMQVLLDHNNLLGMRSAARKDTRRLLYEHIVSGQMPPSQSAQLLATAFATIGENPDGHVVRLERKIGRTIKDMPASQRGEMLANLIETACETGYSARGRERVLLAAAPYRKELLEHLQSPDVQNTEAAGRSIAAWLIKGLDRDTTPHELQVAVAQFVLPRAMSMGDISVRRTLTAELTAKLAVPDGGKSPISEALLRLPVPMRLATASCLLDDLVAHREVPSGVLAIGLIQTVFQTFSETGRTNPTLQEAALVTATILSSLDGRDAPTYRAVFDYADEVMEAIDETLEALPESDSPGDDMSGKPPADNAMHERLVSAQNQLISAIRDDQMKRLQPHHDAPDEVKALREDIARLLVGHDDKLLPCAEQRLPSLKPEIVDALDNQALRWIDHEAKGGERVTWTKPLASRDLVTHLAVAPLHVIGVGSFGVTWLYQTSSPALPKVVIKFPRADCRWGTAEETMQLEFSVYEKIHPGRDRDRTRLCWAFGLADGITHPSTGRPSMALVLEVLDGKDLLAISVEMAIQKSNRVLMDTYIGTHQHVGKEVIEASIELLSYGFSHADLKPENVMVLRNGLVKLIDLGGATMPGNIHSVGFGTPGYAAPEKGPEKGRLNVHGVKMFIPHSNTDTFEASTTLLSAIELLQLFKLPSYTAFKPELHEGHQFHQDKDGNASRAPGQLLKVAGKLAHDTPNHPVGALETYMAKALQENPALRPTLAAAKELPFFADPLIPPEKAVRVLQFLVEQVMRRSQNAKDGANLHDFLLDPEQRATAPLPQIPHSDPGKLLSVPQVFDRWLEMEPGLALSNVRLKLNEAIGTGSDPIILQELHRGLKAFYKTIDSRHNDTALMEMIETLQENLQKVAIPSDAYHPDARSIWDEANSITELVKELREKRARDLCAMPAFRMSSYVLYISTLMAMKNGLTKNNGYLQWLTDMGTLQQDCDTLVNQLWVAMQDLAAQLNKVYSKPPPCLRRGTHLGAIAAKLKKLPPVKSEMRSIIGPESWRGTSSAATGKLDKDDRIDINAEAEELDNARSHGGFGNVLDRAELALLVKNRSTIETTRDGLRNNLKRYWGSGTIADPDIIKVETKMREWLTQLERMLRVIATPPDETMRTNVKERHERFKNGQKQLKEITSRPAKGPVPTLHLLMQGKPRVAPAATRFKELDEASNEPSPDTPGRDEGEETANGDKSKGGWAIGKDSQEIP